MQLKVIKITQETSNIHSFRFERPAGFDFFPGQWVMIFENKDGEQIKRAYSISTSPTIKEYFEISVKLNLKGSMTPFLFDHVKEGDSIEVLGPFGLFKLVPEEQDMIFIGGGSGITPFRAMSRFAADTGMQNSIKLVYAARTPADLAFKPEFDELEKRNPNFHAFYTVDTPTPDWKGHQGLISADILKAHIQDLTKVYYYVVGPQPMITLITGILAKENVPADHIHLDNWG
jgi:ferredoxin-NADP reductase